MVACNAETVVAKKWHYLALFGTPGRGLQCHFVVTGAGIAKIQTVNLLRFMSIEATRKKRPSQCQTAGGRRTR
jgi:hypothetical protein